MATGPTYPPLLLGESERNRLTEKYGTLLQGFQESPVTGSDLHSRSDQEQAIEMNRLYGYSSDPETAETPGYTLVVQQPKGNILGKLGDYLFGGFFNRILGPEGMSKIGAYEETELEVPGSTGLPSQGYKVYTSDPAVQMDDEVKNLFSGGVARMNAWNRALSRVWTDTMVLPLIENTFFGADKAYTYGGQLSKGEIRPAEGAIETLWDFVAAPLIGGLPINIATYLPARAFALRALMQPWARGPLQRLAKLSPELFTSGDEATRALARGLNLSRMPGGAYDRAAATFADVLTGGVFGAGYSAREMFEVPFSEGDESVWKRALWGGVFGAGAGLALGALGNIHAYKKSLKSIKQAFHENGILTDNIVTEVEKRLVKGDVVGGRVYLGPGKDGRGYWHEEGTRKPARSPLRHFDEEGPEIQRDLMNLYIERQIDMVEEASRALHNKPFNQLSKEERGALYETLKAQGKVPDVEEQMAGISEAAQKLAVDRTDPIGSAIGVAEQNNPEMRRRVELSIWNLLQRHIKPARLAWSRKYRTTQSLINEIQYLEKNSYLNPALGDRLEFRARAEALKVAAEERGVDLEKFGVQRSLFPQTKEGTIEAAIDIVDNLSAKETRLQIASFRAQAEAARLNNNIEDATRLEELANYAEYVYRQKSAFDQIIPDAPEEIEKNLRRANTLSNRGLYTGSRVLVQGQDGSLTPMEIVQRPNFGGARAKNLKDPGLPVQEIDISKTSRVFILPEAGDGITLTDGSHGIVLGGLDPQKNTVRVATVKKGMGGVVREYDVDISEIQLVSHGYYGKQAGSQTRATPRTAKWFSRKRATNMLMAPPGTKYRKLPNVEVLVGGRSKVLLNISEDGNWVYMMDSATGLRTEMAAEDFKKLVPKDFDLNNLEAQRVEIDPQTGGVSQRVAKTPEDQSTQTRMKRIDQEIEKLRQGRNAAAADGNEVEVASFDAAIEQAETMKAKFQERLQSGQVRAQEGGIAIGHFVSGQVPREGNRILYVTSETGFTDQFWAAVSDNDLERVTGYLAGQDGITLSLVPQPASTPSGRTVAIEVSGDVARQIGDDSTFKQALYYLRDGKTDVESPGELLFGAKVTYKPEDLQQPGAIQGVFAVDEKLMPLDVEQVSRLKPEDARDLAAKFVNAAAWIPDGERHVFETATKRKQSRKVQRARMPEEREKMRVKDQKTTAAMVEEESELAEEAAGQLEFLTSQENAPHFNALADASEEELTAGFERASQILASLDERLGPRPTLIDKGDPEVPGGYTSYRDYKKAQADYEAREKELIRNLTEEELAPIYSLLEKIPPVGEGEEPITLIFRHPSNPERQIEVGLRQRIAPDIGAELERTVAKAERRAEVSQLPPTERGMDPDGKVREGWRSLPDLIKWIKDGLIEPGYIRGVKIGRSAPKAEAVAAGLKPVKRIPMNFTYGESGALPAGGHEFPTTMDAILGGARTQTTRAPGQLEGVKVGDVVTFFDRQGREVNVRVTARGVVGDKKVPNAATWAAAEGYDPTAAAGEWGRLKGREYVQYELADKPATPKPVKIIGGWKPGAESTANRLATELGYETNIADLGVPFFDEDGNFSPFSFGARLAGKEPTPVGERIYREPMKDEVRAIADEFGVRGPFKIGPEESTRGFPYESGSRGVTDEDAVKYAKGLAERRIPGERYPEVARSVLMGRSADTVIAVAEKTGTGPMDIKGAGAWTARAAVRADRPKRVYVFDPYEGQWYDYTGGKWKKIGVGDVKIEGTTAISGSSFFDPETAHPVSFNPEIHNLNPNPREYGGTYSGTTVGEGTIFQPHPRIKTRADAEKFARLTEENLRTVLENNRTGEQPVRGVDPVTPAPEPEGPGKTLAIIGYSTEKGAGSTGGVPPSQLEEVLPFLIGASRVRDVDRVITGSTLVDPFPNQYMRGKRNPRNIDAFGDAVVRFLKSKGMSDDRIERLGFRHRVLSQDFEEDIRLRRTYSDLLKTEEGKAKLRAERENVIKNGEVPTERQVVEGDRYIYKIGRKKVKSMTAAEDLRSPRFHSGKGTRDINEVLSQEIADGDRTAVLRLVGDRDLTPAGEFELPVWLAGTMRGFGEEKVPGRMLQAFGQEPVTFNQLVQRVRDGEMSLDALAKELGLDAKRAPKSLRTLKEGEDPAAKVEQLLRKAFNEDVEAREGSRKFRFEERPVSGSGETGLTLAEVADQEDPFWQAKSGELERFLRGDEEAWIGRAETGEARREKIPEAEVKKLATERVRETYGRQMSREYADNLEQGNPAWADTDAEWQRRNQEIVDKSDAVLVVWDGTRKLGSPPKVEMLNDGTWAVTRKSGKVSFHATRRKANEAALAYNLTRGVDSTADLIQRAREAGKNIIIYNPVTGKIKHIRGSREGARPFVGLETVGDKRVAVGELRPNARRRPDLYRLPSDRSPTPERARVGYRAPEIIVRSTDQADGGAKFRSMRTTGGGKIPGSFVQEFVLPALRGVEREERIAAQRAGRRSPIEVMYEAYLERQRPGISPERAAELEAIYKGPGTYSDPVRALKANRRFLERDLGTVRPGRRIDQSVERQALSTAEQVQLGYTEPGSPAVVEGQYQSPEQIAARQREEQIAEGFDPRGQSHWEERGYLDAEPSLEPRETKGAKIDEPHNPYIDFLPPTLARAVKAGEFSPEAERYMNWLTEVIGALRVRMGDDVDPRDFEAAIKRVWFGKQGAPKSRQWINLVGALSDEDLARILRDFTTMSVKTKKWNRMNPFPTSQKELAQMRFRALQIADREGEIVGDIVLPQRNVSPPGQVRRLLWELRQARVDADHPVMMMSPDEWRHGTNPRLHATTRQTDRGIMIYIGRDAQGYKGGSIPAGPVQYAGSPAEARDMLRQLGFFPNDAAGPITADAVGRVDISGMKPINEQSFQELRGSHRQIAYAIQFYRHRGHPVPESLQQLARDFYARWRQLVDVTDTFLWGKENQEAVGLTLPGSEPGKVRRAGLPGEIDDTQLSLLENPELKTPTWQEMESMPPAERAWYWQKMGMDQYDQQRFLALAHLDTERPLTGDWDPLNPDPLDPFMNMVVVGKGPNARVGVLERPNVGVDNRSATVRFYDEARGWYTEEIAKSELDPSLLPGDPMDVEHLDALNGQTIAGILPTSPMGSGVLDERLNIAGITNRKQFHAAIEERLGKILEGRALDQVTEEVVTTGQTRIQKPKLSTFESYSKADVDELVDLYIRSVDTATYSNQNVFEQMLKRQAKRLRAEVDPEFMTNIKALAYDRLHRMHSKDVSSKSAEVLVQAKLGLLSNARKEALISHAKKMGIKTEKRPIWQVAEEVLANLDSNLARTFDEASWKNLLHNLWTDETGAMPLGLDLSRIPWLGTVVQRTRDRFFPDMQVTISDLSPPKDLNILARWIGLPKTVADRHPTFQYLYRSTIRADIAAKKAAQDFNIRLTDHWMPRDPDGKHIRTAMSLYQRGYHTWQQVVENLDPKEFESIPASLSWSGRGKRPDIAFGDFFDDYAETMQRVRRGLLKGHLMSGHTAVTYNEEDPLHAVMALHDLYLNERIKALGGHKKAHGKTLMAGRDPRTGVWADRDPDEVDFFLDKIIGPEPRAWEDVDPEVRQRVAQEGWKWMIDEFEFWNNLGRNDPLPLAHEGRVQVKVIGTNEHGVKYENVVGYGANVPDVLRLIRTKVREGDPRFTAAGIQDIQLTVDQVNLTGNDFQYGTDIRTLERLTKEIARDGGIPREELAVITGASLPPKGTSVRMEGTTKTSLQDDPYQRLGLLFRRAVQSEYKTAVQRAAHQAMLLDAQFAKVFGSGRLFPDIPRHKNYSEMVLQARSGPVQSANARAYFDAYLSRALGKPGLADQMLDWTLARWAYIKALPPKVAEKMLTDHNVDFKYRASEFYKPFRGRQLSANILNLQAVMRLGLSPAAAAVNGMQWSINTVPLLGFDNVMGAWKDLAVFRTYSKEVFEKLADQYGKDWYRLWKESNGRLDIPELRDPKVQDALKLYDIIDEAGVTLAMPRSQRATSWGTEMDEMPNRLLADPNQPVFEGALEKLWDWGSLWSLYGFNKMEKVNRVLTAFAAARKAETVGIKDVAGKVAFITDMIDRTQFTYSDVGLSPIMANPIGKVLFQFKPFLQNQLRFEVDLMKRAARGSMAQRKDAAKALVQHFGTIGLLGGSSSVMFSPAFFLLGAGLSKFDQDTSAEGFINKILLNVMGGGGYLEQGVDRFNSPYWNPRAFWTHGLFGLLGTDISRRLSLSGPELLFTTNHDVWSSVLGPHVGMYKAALDVLNDPEVRTPAWAKVGVGLPALILGAPALKGAGGIIGGIGGTALASAASDTPLITGDAFDADKEIFKGELWRSKSGRNFMQRAMPTFFRNLDMAADILTTGITWDAGLNPTYWSALAYQNGTRFLPGVEPVQESQIYGALLALVGLRPVEQSLTRAQTQLLQEENDKWARTQDMYADMVAESYFRGDVARALELAAEAQVKYGITITKQMFMPRIDHLRSTRTEKTMNEAITPLRRRRLAESVSE